MKLFTDGPDRILPHVNPEFRSARFQITDSLAEAENNLRYAEDFGLSDADGIKELRNNIVQLRLQLKESKQ
jgi:DNA-directed RNA polymerase subunit F